MTLEEQVKKVLENGLSVFEWTSKKLSNEYKLVIFYFLGKGHAKNEIFEVYGISRPYVNQILKELTSPVINLLEKVDYSQHYKPTDKGKRYLRFIDKEIELSGEIK